MQGTGRPDGKVLKVQMLGDFRITLDGEEIKLPGGIYSKTTRLFLLIIYYKEQGISKESALEFLYGDGEYADDSGSLRVVSHRLKKHLTQAGILGEKGSINKKGVFRLEQEGIDVQADVRLFEDNAHRALEARSKDNKTALLEQACQMYTGEFLPSLSAEIWVAGKQARYQNLYFQCLRPYLRALSEMGQYEKMLCTARNVLRMYPYEEWYVAELDALIGLERWQVAQEVSRQSVKAMMEQMGVRPSEAMKERMTRINNKLKGSAKNLTEIRRELEESNEDPGAYFCSYASFTGTYNYEMRRIERTGESLYLALCSLTVRDEEGASKVGEGIFENTVENLGTAIRISLRRADVYTRYGKNQYLMLLADLKQEDCDIISRRIERNFEKNPGAGRFMVSHFVTSASPDGRVKEKCEEEAPLKFKKSIWGDK